MTDPTPLRSTRETVVEIINNHPALMADGLPENAVFQADTISSPTMRPFIVIRWLNEMSGVGPSTVRPFDLWGYDEEGDYTRIEKILYDAAEILMDVIAQPTVSGMLSQIQGRANSRTPGLGRGSDLYDDGYKCIVIPWHLQAIARGL